MSMPVVVLLIMGAVFLTLALERNRGVVEPYKYKELEEEVKDLEKQSTYWRQEWERTNEENKRLREELDALKQQK